MSNFEFYGKSVHWDKDLSEITISTKFMTPENIQTIIDFINEDKYVKVRVSLVKQFSKTQGQLARYFRSVVRILTKSEVEPSKENVSHFDMEFKKSVLDCSMRKVGKIEIPFVPSKAEMSYEEMYDLNQKLEETYSFLGIDFSLPAEVDK